LADNAQLPGMMNSNNLAKSLCEKTAQSNPVELGASAIANGNNFF
jgi:hypothetical protein